MKIPFYRASVGREEEEAASAAIRSGWLTTAGIAREFETEFRAWMAGRVCVATNSCTSALHLALLLHDIGPGDEVIVPSVTFAATANVVAHAGATIVFADVDSETGLLTPETVRAAATKATKAILLVHLHGLPADPAPLRAAAPGAVAIIEDCAHAFPAAILPPDAPERPAGTLGETACFSFYATKNVTAGEGGMLVLGDSSMEDRARSLLLHGMSADAWKRYHGTGARYQILEAGYKYNLPDPLAAIGRVQLAKIGIFQAKREALWRRYTEAFSGINGIAPPADPSGLRHARHIYALRVRPGEPAPARAAARDSLAERLALDGIATSVHFGALHREPAYANLRVKGLSRWGDMGGAESFSDGSLSLPFYPDLSEEAAAKVITSVRAGEKR